MSDRDLEQETIVRWSRDTGTATLYTADAYEMRRWQKLGYPVEICGRRQGKPSAWQALVPAQAIALLPMKGAAVVVSRYLESPTLAVKAQGRQTPDQTDEKAKENRSEFSGGGTTAAGQG